MSKACHPHKEAAQPEEKRRQTGWLQAKTCYFFPPFFYYFYCEEGAGDTKPHTIRSQKNRAVLGKIYRQLLFAQVTTEPSVLLVWNPTMQSVLSQALQGRSWQVLAWNTPRVPPTLSPPSRGHFTLRSHLNETISEKQNKLNNKIIKKKKRNKVSQYTLRAPTHTIPICILQDLSCRILCPLLKSFKGKAFLPTPAVRKSGE